MSILLKTPTEIMSTLALKAKTQRLKMNLSQDGVARRSGVSLGSLKRFEATGQISLESLLKIALSLNCLTDFDHIFSASETGGSLFQQSGPVKQRQRGSLK